ncbi:MAG: universal stress protein [Alphaproteobacteria bacterium]
MYRKIMVPVDLEHADALDKALTTAAGLAEQHGAAVTYVAVTTSAPGPVAQDQGEFAGMLDAFAKAQGRRFGIETTGLAKVSHDPTTDLNRTLMATAEEIEADLIVMASHVPGVIEHLFASHAGYVASHAKMSVFVVR